MHDSRTLLHIKPHMGMTVNIYSDIYIPSWKIFLAPHNLLMLSGNKYFIWM